MVVKERCVWDLQRKSVRPFQKAIQLKLFRQGGKQKQTSPLDPGRGKVMRVAVIQMNSQNDPGHNLEAADMLLTAAAKQGAKYALLPENFAFFGSEQEKLAKAGEISAAVRDFLSKTAGRLAMTITGGGFPIPAAAGKVFNTAATYGPDGQEIHSYNKIHLFDASPGDNVSYLESRSTAAGARDLSLFKLDAFRIGMTVCYDVRFPQLYRAYAREGADVLCIPAAFTRLTGAAHWHSLLKARAIENTCYLLAAAQTGTHFGGRETFGHSMIIDPWGETLAELNDRPGFITADIDLRRVEEVRSRMPSLSQDQF